VSQRLAGGLVGFRPALTVELEWLDRLLEAARDAQVIGERLAAELDRQPAELLSEFVRRQIGREWQQQGRRAQIALVQALNSRRYLALLDALEEVAAERERAAEQEPGSVGPADLVSGELTRLAIRAHQRLLRAMKAAERDGLDQGSSLDRLLTAVGRTRYTAEAVAVVIGKPARRYASQAAKLQAMLQDQHDVVRLRSELIALAGRAHRDPDTAFSYGRLHAGLERQLGLDADAFADRWSGLITRAERWPGR
jgi:CHAD domain-containing protein